MAEHNSIFLILGLLLFYVKDAVSEYSCLYDCSGLTCVTYCDHGCCGTFDNRYCCSAYSGIATIVGAVIGGLIVLGVIIAIIIFCVMAYQKKKRSVHPRTVQPATHNNIVVNNNNNRSHRPARPIAAPPYSVGLPPSYNELYPEYNTNNTQFTNHTIHPNAIPTDQPSIDAQPNHQYGQPRIPNSPPPAY